MFTELMCDAPLGSITRQHAARFLETIGRLRADYGKLGNANSLPLDKLLELHRGEPHLSNTTLNRHALALSGLFKWAIGAGLYETSNPFAGQRRNVGRSSRSRWQPFRIDELNQLFTHPLLQVSFKDRVTPKRHSPQTALMWLPAIALFSGLRQDEICGLRVKDVKTEIRHRVLRRD